MITNLDSQTGTSLSITSEATVATYTTAADGEVSGRLNLSALNGAAAVITVKVQLLDSGSTKLGVPVAFSATKDAAADTIFSAVWGPIRVTSGQKLRVRASSTNSSDTGASWESKMDDAGASQVASATTADSKTLLTSGTGTGQVNPSSGGVDLQTIKTQTVTAAAGVTFPTSIASPTNITAGVITTVTTLTNLPAVPTDWLTAAGVKADAVTKIQSGLATPTNITAGTITTVSGNVTGSVGGISGITFPTHFSILAINASGLVTTSNPSAGLSGPSSVTETFVDASAQPVPFAAFTLLSADKSSVIGSGIANSNGVATFGANDGSYYVAIAPTGSVAFPVTALTVSGTTSQTITGTSIIPTPSPDPGACTIYDTTRGVDDSIKAGVTYNYRITSGAAGTFNRDTMQAVSAGTGSNNINFTVQRGATVKISRGTFSVEESFVVPNSASAQLTDLLLAASNNIVIGSDGSTP